MTRCCYCWIELYCWVELRKTNDGRRW